ncbi:MAG: sodium:solute symporter family protein [Fastidiosipilaceae bacterium]|jgi:SSS family solute:Na+ symporter
MSATTIWIALIVYIVFGTIIAFISKRGMREGLTEYFLANRGVSGIVAAGTYSATSYSAFMTIGLAGLIYTGGVGALGFELLYLSGMLLVVFFGPRLWLAGKKYGYITPYEMLADRFKSKHIAIVSAIVALIFLIPYSAVQLMGVGYLMEGLSGGSIAFMTGVIFATVLAVFWALIAGMRSVAYTDTLMAVVMLTATLLCLFAVVNNGLGGFVNMFETLERDLAVYMTVPGPGYFTFGAFISLSLPWFFFSLATPHVTQRLYINKNMKSMQIMLKAFLAFGAIYTLAAVLWGFSAKILVPSLQNPDMATPTLLSLPVVPTWVAVLLLVGIVAACISTIDSIMLCLSSLVSKDIYSNLVDNASERTQLYLGQGCIIILAIAFALFASLKLDLIGVLSVASSAGLLSTVPTIFAAFFWKRGTAAGAISSIVVGACSSLYMQYAGITILGIGAGVWTLVITAVVFIVVSLLTQPPTEKAEEFIGDIEQALAEKNAI